MVRVTNLPPPGSDNPTRWCIQNPPLEADVAPLIERLEWDSVEYFLQAFNSNPALQTKAQCVIELVNKKFAIERLNNNIDDDEEDAALLRRLPDLLAEFNYMQLVYFPQAFALALLQLPTVVGLYELNPVRTHSLKARGFNPCSYYGTVSENPGFQSLLSNSTCTATPRTRTPSRSNTSG